MASFLFNKWAVTCISVLFLFSCQPEVIQDGPAQIEQLNFTAAISDPGRISETNKAGIKCDLLFNENLRDLVYSDTPSPDCGATAFSEVQWKHFTQLASDPIATGNFSRYLYLNHHASRLNLDFELYFGPDGEYTSLVNRISKDLKRFWNMEGLIEVRGQHNETLNDREKLVELFSKLIFDDISQEELYDLADEILWLNQQSPLLPESPLLASEGYSTAGGLIVIGDGLIQMFVEAGIEPDIAWTGILTHEWIHQIQIEYYYSWYPAGSFDTPAEETRQIELEADFFSAYYMTHKRGATMNWKRTTEFLDLFFQAGDCSFEFVLHHGTPQQRMQAAMAGYDLAASAQKKGKILSTEEVHEYFLETLPQIL